MIQVDGMIDRHAFTRLTSPTRPTCLHRQRGPEDRPKADLSGRPIEPRRSIDAVAIDQRERFVAERVRLFDERFGQRCTFQEAEGR